MKISNTPVKYEVLIKQYLRSILDTSVIFRGMFLKILVCFLQRCNSEVCLSVAAVFCPVLRRFWCHSTQGSCTGLFATCNLLFDFKTIQCYTLGSTCWAVPSSRHLVSWGTGQKMASKKIGEKCSERKCSVSPCFSPIFSLAVFRVAPQLTGRLEEARWDDTLWICKVKGCLLLICLDRIHNIMHWSVNQISE